MVNIKKTSQIYQAFQKTSDYSNFFFGDILFPCWRTAIGRIFAKFYVFVAVLEQKMYVLAIIGLLTTVMSAFYYLKIIKTIYFDESSINFESVKNKSALTSIFISCSVLLTFFLYPSILNDIVNSLFVS